MAATILVSENHRPTALAIKNAFSHLGYSLKFKPDTNQALDYLGTNSVDALVIGTEPSGLRQDRLCEEVRKRGHQTPIMVITDRRDLDHSIRVLRQGADDYVAKQSYRELVARTVKLINRPPSSKIIRFKVGDLTHIPSSQKFLDKHGNELNLKPKEYQILNLMASQLSRPVSREMIAARLSRYSKPSSPEAIDVHICRIRKLLHPGHGLRIKSIYGVGYRLDLT